ncbi:MAG: arginase family protein [Candidatus Methanomethylicia archaeon]|nr:arginase family protein [Candidatus Methanomethylicia archaeon]
MASLQLFNGLIDPDERESKIRQKIEGMRNGYSQVRSRDPFYGVLSNFVGEFKPNRLEVEEWLLPTPPPQMQFMLTVENFVTFIDSNGCLEYSKKIEEMVERAFPALPVMIGVDHSLSGGSIRATCREYGGENIRLVLFDSHFDFILPTIRCGLIQYDVETNPESKFSKGDPYIFSRPDSYNADSFLYYLMGSLPPENIYVIGVSDYPPKVAEEIDDRRVKDYVQFYKGIEEKGVHVVRREAIESGISEIKELLSSAKLPLTYVSIDIDVCANTSLKGARFQDYNGLDHHDLYSMCAALAKSNSKLIGLDIMEFDVYSAGSRFMGKEDRTYQIAAEALRKFSIL